MTKGIGHVPGRVGLPTHERLREMAADDPTPRKVVIVEWVGEPSPMSRPEIVIPMLKGELTMTQKQAVRKAAATAVTRAGGRRRVLERGDDFRAIAPVPGLRRTYIWEPANRYRCACDLADADLILGLPCGHEFRLVDDA